jgi:tetratricopeptide (TPR) repeat protein
VGASWRQTGVRLEQKTMMALLAGKRRLILLLGILVGLGVVVALLTGSGPRTYDDAMRAAVQAHARGDLKTAERYYATAFEKADSVGNGNRAVVAGDAVADLAVARGDLAKAQALYQHLLAIYPVNVRSMPLRFKVENNLAVIQYRQGRYPEAQAIFEEAAATWRKYPYSPFYPFEVHFLLLRHLAKVYQAQGWSVSADETTQWVIEIVRWTEQTRSAVRPPSGEVLLEYAALLRAADHLDDAAEIETWGRAIMARYAETIAKSGPSGFQRCESVSRYGTRLPETCYLEIP